MFRFDLDVAREENHKKSQKIPKNPKTRTPIYPSLDLHLSKCKLRAYPGGTLVVGDLLIRCFGESIVYGDLNLNEIAIAPNAAAF